MYIIIETIVITILFFIWISNPSFSRFLILGSISFIFHIIANVIQERKWEREREREEERRKREKEEAERQEKRRKEEEEQRRKAAEERNRKKGDDLYHQAIAGNEVDEDLVRRAADLGCRPACLYVGRQMMKEWSTGAYTKEEKAKIAKKAKEYFHTASSGENSIEHEQGFLAKAKTEATFGYLMFQAITESGTASKWKDVLSQLRNIQKSGMLPEEYNGICTKIIDTVINLIDTDTSTPSNTSKPVIKRRYCKFCNAGICTRSSYLSSCRYTSDPGNCATALLEGGLGFEFEK